MKDLLTKIINKYDELVSENYDTFVWYDDLNINGLDKLLMLPRIYGSNCYFSLTNGLYFMLDDKDIMVDNFDSEFDYLYIEYKDNFNVKSSIDLIKSIDDFTDENIFYLKLSNIF